MLIQVVYQLTQTRVRENQVALQSKISGQLAGEWLSVNREEFLAQNGIKIKIRNATCELDEEDL